MKKFFSCILPVSVFAYFSNALIASADTLNELRATFCQVESIGETVGIGSGGGIGCLLIRTQSILNMLLPLFATLAVVGFFYGLAKYVFNAGNEEARKEGKQVIIAGIVTLFLMAAIGGIISFLVSSTVGAPRGGFFDIFDDSNEINVPGLEDRTGGGSGGGVSPGF